MVARAAVVASVVPVVLRRSQQFHKTFDLIPIMKASAVPGLDFIRMVHPVLPVAKAATYTQAIRAALQVTVPPAATVGRGSMVRHNRRVAQVGVLLEQAEPSEATAPAAVAAVAATT